MAEGFDFRNGGPQSFVLDTPTAPTSSQGAPVAQGSAQLRGAVGAETPQAQLMNAVSYTHLTLPTIYSV